MSLQFIFGNSGAGKSHHLYKEVVTESLAYPDTNYIVLVPEQFTMQTQKDLCMAHPNKGIMNIDVLSFIRLSHRIFEETGRETKRVLDDEGKNLILRKIAGQYESELKVLRGNLKKQGYISEVKSVISEFTQYGIGFDELDEMIDSLGEESYLSYKLRDIRTVYGGFENYLADKYITKEELLDVLSDAVPESKILKDSVVVLDGYTGFTPVQNRLLGELLKVCKKVMITVEMDQRENPFVYKHPYQLFALSKQMVTSLVEIAGENRIPVDEPVYLYEKTPYRFRDNPAMAFLENELFRYKCGHYTEEQNAISLYVTRNPKEEANFVAAQIRRLAREEGIRYREMGVIVSEMGTYANHLEKACEEYQIPIFMDHKKSILLNAFVEYLRSLLAMEEENFSYESVFRFLRTGMSGFTREEVDRMENYVIALGLRGYSKWSDKWVRTTYEMKRKDAAEQKELAASAQALDSLNRLRERFVKKIETLTKVLKKRKKTVKEITIAVHEFLLQEKMQENVQEMENYFQEQGELALAKEYSQVYRIVMELFDKFVELLGDEEISLKEYNELLDAGLEEAKVGVIPPSLDQVVIGDMERTRLNHLKVLFFVGANDVFLPGNLGQGGLLSDRDREQFAEQKFSLSPGAKEKTYTQKFYLYMNLTKPSEKLYLSYSKTSSDGKGLRPAYLIQDLKRMYPNLEVIGEEKKSLSEKEMTWMQGAEYLVDGLAERQYGLSDEWKELYSWYFEQEKNQENPLVLQRILDAAFYKKEKEQLKKETAKDLYGNTERVSVTRLERFSSCAYAHFLTYGLRLSERERYQFEAMDLGNIAHQSMERFARKADDIQVEWTAMTEEVKDRFIQESVEESILEYGNTVLYSTARNEYTITRIKNLIQRSVWALTKQMAESDFRPSLYEFNFGSGKIDRIDTCEDENGVYVKVTDYKTGMKAFDITAFYHGLQIQLPVYLNAALDVEQKRHKGKEIIPAGIFYYRMQDPIVDKEEDDEVLEGKILKELRLDGLVNADEVVVEHLQHNLEGTSNYIPVSKTKSGALSKTSKALYPDEFLEFLDYTKKLEAKLKGKIADGEVQAEPYEMGGATGCDYCAYRAICGFDTRIEGYEYRRLEKYSKEDVLEKIHIAAQEER